MDVSGDVFGLLAAHPLSPLVSLHHLEHVDPIFPTMTRPAALQHLFEAAKVDPHRLLQQCVCYDRWFTWTVSVSWGYAVEVFGNHVFLPDVLRRPETFRPWKKGSILNSLYSFDVRIHHHDPCRRPSMLFLDKVSFEKGGIMTTYRKMVPENCSFDMSSPRRVEEIRVHSQKLDLDIKQLRAPRRHCCDVLPSTAGKTMDIGIRECRDEELIYMHP